MSIPCAKCNRPESSSKWVVSSHYGKEVIKQYYCSQDCYNSSKSTDTVTIGVVLLIMTIGFNLVFLFGGRLPTGLLALSPFLILDGILIVATVYMIGLGEKHQNIVINNFEGTYDSNISKWLHKKNTKDIQDNYEVDPETNTVYISELRRNVRICCYNAARLGDAYCMCGRGIEVQLHELFV